MLKSDISIEESLSRMTIAETTSPGMDHAEYKRMDIPPEMIESIESLIHSIKTYLQDVSRFNLGTTLKICKLADRIQRLTELFKIDSLLL